MDAKLTILEHIYENRDVLFGKFSDNLTHEMKINRWKHITEQLRGLGLFHKDWKYLRDTTWQNWRKRTVEKRDNRFQTGSGGGKKCKYDDSDELILKIIGKNSPVLEGLPVPESSGSQECLISVQNSTQQNINMTPTHQPPRRKSHRISTEHDFPNDITNLKKQKMELELKLLQERVEIAKREKYKLDLELLKMEKELNIKKPSNFTLPLYSQNVRFTDSVPEDMNEERAEQENEIQIIYVEETNNILHEAINNTL